MQRQEARDEINSPGRINSKSSGLRRASSLQDTYRQGAGDSSRDCVGWDLVGRDGNNSFLNPDTFQKEFVLASFNLFQSELKNALNH